MIEEQKKNKIEMVQSIFLGLLGLGLIIKIFIPGLNMLWTLQQLV